jgi:hypothetical protein
MFDCCVLTSLLAVCFFFYVFLQAEAVLPLPPD